jgi:tRNA-Thr(GGU) m(6)t(6)A37 methyltransferase TsaA
VSVEIKEIARIRTDFPEKFGIPRQSGRVAELRGEIVFLPEYQSREALRGLEGYSHIWLVWGFSANAHDAWSPTVRPPRLGGNRRVGVFATRSPYRPNPLGLSVVKLEKIELDGKDAPRLVVSGADLMDGTPIYDIKPYLPHADAIEGARGGFSADFVDYALRVAFPDELLSLLPEDKRAAAASVLAEDPRPSYQDDPAREYGMSFGGFEIYFKVADGTLTVVRVEKTALPFSQ